MTFVSFIVTCFNVESYIEQCIDSVLNQNFKDYEVIVVNDGSTDNTLNILSKYKNIKIINKENGGASSSRNVGLNHATGKYILFVYGDDFIHENCLSEIYNNTNDEDVVLLNLVKYKKDSIENIVNYKKLEKKYIDDRIYELVNQNNFVSSPCNKLMKKQFLIENNLYFKEGIKSEDIDWSIRILLCVTNFSVIDYPYYYYRHKREGSVSTTVSNSHIYNLTDAIYYSLELMKNSGISSLREKAIYEYISYQYMILMAYYVEINDKEYKDKIKNLKYLLKYNNSKKVKIIYLLNNIIGYYLSGLFMNFFVRKIR